MEEKVFIEEKAKLKEITKKILEEEENLEEYLSNVSMNYDLENIAQAKVVESQIQKLENIKKIKD